MNLDLRIVLVDTDLGAGRMPDLRVYYKFIGLLVIDSFTNVFYMLRSSGVLLLDVSRFYRYIAPHGF